MLINGVGLLLQAKFRYKSLYKINIFKYRIDAMKESDIII